MGEHDIFREQQESWHIWSRGLVGWRSMLRPDYERTQTLP